MDLEPLVRQASEGDVKAFVELTRRFQHFAFGSALALVHDFQKAGGVSSPQPVVFYSTCDEWTMRSLKCSNWSMSSQSCVNPGLAMVRGAAFGG